MSATVLVNFDDLRLAYEWASADAAFDNEAWVSRVTGKVHWSSSIGDTGIEDELPEDIADGSVYLAVPHRNDLDVGRALVMRFVEEHLPESCDVVLDIFRHRGAYARFKSLLERKNQLHAWFQYEERAVENALREWSAENDLQLE